LKTENPQKKTSIGGSALIEGVMMRGPRVSAMAVRKPDGTIDLSEWPSVKGEIPWYKKTPFIRGIFNFIDSMAISYRCLTRSAEIAGMEEEEEPTGFEKKLYDLLGDKVGAAIGVVSLILGLLLAVCLFIFLPTALVSLLRGVTERRIILTLAEAVVKIAIFITYIWLISKMPDIRRTFEYHGAEHKTIACYEAGEELTVENVRRHTRFHPRCGTSFILIVLIVSALVFSFVSWDNLIGRVLLKLVCLPVVIGIAYEIIKLAGRSENPIMKCVSQPGLWTQRLTTREPDDSQIECAIAAMKPCIPENSDEDRW
jgi:uncharacterized protein YqhQ